MTSAVRETDPTQPARDASMNTELFGVFGDREAFTRYRRAGAFDHVVEGDRATVGVRCSDLGVPGRSTTYACDRGACVLFGEVVGPRGIGNPAEWVFDRYANEGTAALDSLNGSYLAFVAADGDPIVATDPLRSWECYYADVDGDRVFGTDVAALKSLVDDRRPDAEGILEMLHLGTVLGERTLFESVHRVPPDAYLTESGTEQLRRFVYEPERFDYVGELADRLGRAIKRRAHYPGTKGLLLSGGHDSRLLLSQVPDIERTYTVGSEDSREVRVAEKLSEQYDATHDVLEPGERYLYPSDEKLLYSQGIKEALHIHHAGYEAEFDVDVMYHGLLFDTLFKGYFLEWDDRTVFDATLPADTLVEDPDPVDSLLDTLGFVPEESVRVPAAVADLFDDLGVDVDLRLDSPRDFLAERMRAELNACRERADSLHNATDLLVIRNQPVMPFRTHLADNFVEPFVAMDAELLDWHLRTPPEYRHSDTFKRAGMRLDEDVFRHAAPSKPYSSDYLNLFERFVRQVVPFVEEFEPAWPDRGEVYEENAMGERLFPEHSRVRDLPERQQLRVNGIRWWLS